MIDQSGNGNKAVQEQSNPGTITDFNYASINQQGKDGKAFQYQYGVGDYAKIVQKGKENYGYQSQDASSVNVEAQLLQNGSGNWSKQMQTGVDNYSKVTQTGMGHISNVVQSGMGNSNTVSQSN
jgi:hypothetical protein